MVMSHLQVVLGETFSALPIQASVGRELEFSMEFALGTLGLLGVAGVIVWLMGRTRRNDGTIDVNYEDWW